MKLSDDSIIQVISYSLLLNEKPKTIYNLYIYSDKNIPLMHKGYLVFFDNKRDIKQAFNYFDKVVKIKFSIPKEIDYECDIDRVINKIKNSKVDHIVDILDCINILDDFIIAIDYKLDKIRRNIIYRFADHLTFNRRYGKYLEENNISRKELIEIINLHLENIFKNSKLLVKNNGKYELVNFNKVYHFIRYK